MEITINMQLTFSLYIDRQTNNRIFDTNIGRFPFVKCSNASRTKKFPDQRSEENKRKREIPDQR